MSSKRVEVVCRWWATSRMTEVTPDCQSEDEG